jgi:hypothetical protein
VIFTLFSRHSFVRTFPFVSYLLDLHALSLDIAEAGYFTCSLVGQKTRTMNFFNLPHACILLLIAYFAAEVAAAYHDHDARTHRMLRAATRRSDLHRRSMRITRRFETEVVYVDSKLCSSGCTYDYSKDATDENVWSDESTFASQVKVASQKPVVNLEEHEHHLQDVQCDDGMMKLQFVDASSARDARAACHGPDGGLIITSHESCNEEGERSVYQ